MTRVDDDPESRDHILLMEEFFAEITWQAVQYFM